MHAGDSERFVSLREVAAAAVLQVGCDEVANAVILFPQGSGAGPSGLRYLAPRFRDEVLHHLIETVNFLARGRAPATVQERIC